MKLIMKNYMYDHVVGQSVHLYEDKFHRCWLAVTPMALFRVSHKSADSDFWDSLFQRPSEEEVRYKSLSNISKCMRGIR